MRFLELQTVSEEHRTVALSVFAYLFSLQTARNSLIERNAIILRLSFSLLAYHGSYQFSIQRIGGNWSDKKMANNQKSV